MHSYQYDEDNRLWAAKGTSPNSPLSYDQYMSYSPAGAIGKKDIQMNSIKNSSTQSYTYWGRYEYTSQSNPYAAQYIYDENNNYTLDETLCWDRAGNLSLSASNATGKEAMYWTEDNRMQLYMRMGGDNSVAYYRYDHTGKREMKLRGRLMDVYNMGNQYKFVNFDDMVLYAGDLATFDRQGFKKHYFVEGRRFLTNVGSVGDPNIKPQEDITGKNSELSDEFAQYLDKCFIEHPNSCDPYITEDVYFKLTEVKEIARLYRAILLEGTDNIPYYLHTDRLGSGTVVTNEKGDAVHILTYMPHGETLLDLSQDFETPYQFTGYEKDPESGLYYAGARYQVPRLGSFNSTDPLWWKSPDKTSYHYCANNPIMLVDPDGNNPIDPRTGKEISMNLYCAAVYDNYENKRITPVLDKSLYNSAKPYNYQNRRQFNKPDGMWTGATYNERGYNLSNLSSGAYAILSNFFPDNKHIDASYETPNDYMWMQMAEQGSYVFVDNAWDESLWLHSTIKSFNIITVTENRITQIINLTRGSGKDKYNVNSITSFDISVGDIQSRQRRTWLGGSRTEQYRILNVIETTKNYKNNQPYGTPTVKTYQTEELVK